jgi:hypothetical protein
MTEEVWQRMLDASKMHVCGRQKIDEFKTE